MRLKFIPGFAVLLLFLWSCNSDRNDPLSPNKTRGFKPVYSPDGNISGYIKSGAPQLLKHPGKIYFKDGYIYINEISRGVHVVNNLDPNNPKVIGFIYIPGNIDIAIKGNQMYADYSGGLATINISEPSSVTVNSFGGSATMKSETYPPDNLTRRFEGRVYFECADPSKGYVVGWEETTIEKPKCFKN